MTGISIGASKNTTGLMAGVAETSAPEVGGEHNGTERKSWLEGESNASTTADTRPGMASRLSSSFAMPKSNVALSVATSMASSAASATAGAIVTGAKAGANAAKTAVVQRRESQPNNNSSRWTSRLSWSKTNSAEKKVSNDTTDESSTAAPSWTRTSAGGLSMGGKSDYGVEDHLSTQSVFSSWGQSGSKIFRRNTSPAVLQRQDETLANVSHLSLYGGLLSRPPSSISFVILRPSNTSNPSKLTEANPRSSRQKLRNLLGVRLVKSQSTNHRFQVVRDDWQDENGEETVAKTDSLDSEEISPLLPPQLTVLLRPGDALESVDGMAVGGRRRSILTLGKNRCCDEEDLYNIINKQQDKMDEESVGAVSENAKQPEMPFSGAYFTTTLTFVCNEISAPLSEQRSSLSDTTTIDDSTTSVSSSTPETDTSVTMTDVDASAEEKETNSDTPAKAAVVPLTPTTLPMVHKAYFVDQSGEAQQDSFFLNEFLTLGTVQKSVLETSKTSRFSIGNKASSATSPSKAEGIKAGSSLLHMGPIPETHWLAKQRKIKEGNVLLCADDTPCYNGELAPGDLSMVWLTKVVSLSKSVPFVGITTCSTPPTTMDSIRKTAVAATGGALVGTGAVLMVTPLHPVGHAMALGGLGVLGTEFETPKKAFQKAKQSAASLAARVKKQPSVATDAAANEQGLDSNNVDTTAATSAGDNAMKDQSISVSN